MTKEEKTCPFHPCCSVGCWKALHETDTLCNFDKLEQALAAQAKQHEAEKIRINMIQCKKLAELADKLIEKHNAEKKRIFEEVAKAVNEHISWLQRWCAADTSEEFIKMIRIFEEDWHALKKKWCKE